MTREDAIENLRRLQNLLFNAPYIDTSTIITTCNTAIQALEQEPCEDAISREWLKTAIHNFYYGLKHTPTEEDIQAYIDAAPSVSTEKTGHWIYDKTIENWRCSKCNETPKTMGYVGTADFMAEHFKFCDHCGARMVEPQESEDCN